MLKSKSNAVLSDLQGVLKNLREHPLNKMELITQFNINSLRFLVQKIMSDKGFKDGLFSVIDMSKLDKSVEYAATNAISLLILAKVSFVNRDF